MAWAAHTHPKPTQVPLPLPPPPPPRALAHSPVAGNQAYLDIATCKIMVLFSFAQSNVLFITDTRYFSGLGLDEHERFNPEVCFRPFLSFTHFFIHATSQSFIPFCQSCSSSPSPPPPSTLATASYISSFCIASASFV